jgi:hypothetical protein
MFGRYPIWPTGDEYWYPVEQRRDTIRFHRVPLRKEYVWHGWEMRCVAVIWPAPGSPLELLRMQLDLPGVEALLWKHLRATFTPEISEQLRRLVYRTFLESQYWLLVKGLLLQARHDRCQDCGGAGPLDVHHLTYAHRGAEIWHLDDLALLCPLCHGQRHHTDGAVATEEKAADEP